jgi:hypothetical protein
VLQEDTLNGKTVNAIWEASAWVAALLGDHLEVSACLTRHPAGEASPAAAAAAQLPCGPPPLTAMAPADPA